MQKKIWCIGIAMLLAGSLPLQAQTKFGIKGIYTAWGYTQQNFFLGKISQQDDYVVQMLRLNLSFAANDNVHAVTRFDLGQGWWGVNNEFPRYGAGSGSQLFDNKDTNFMLHVDQAFVWFRIPSWKTAITVGRAQWRLGNKLLLDNNLDGIFADIGVGANSVRVGWAKMSENYDGLSDKTDQKLDMTGRTDARDADLFMADFKKIGPKNSWDLYAFYYLDRSGRDGLTYLIDGLRYNRPRFTPQINSLVSVGASGQFTLGKVKLSGELDYLVGKDNIANTTHAGPANVNPAKTDALKYDINNGDLFGYNILLKAVLPGRFAPGLIFGLGSGDKDPTSGKGNVNKLRTSGFFYVTEIWEDSVMPDEEGITPQGLGAPNTRGYRELENTTLVQANATYNFSPQTSVFASFTYLRATQPIYAWTTSNGPNLDVSSKDIGQEIDARLTHKIQKSLVVAARFGIFFPGKGAQYLINGNDTWSDSALEVRATLAYKF